MRIGIVSPACQPDAERLRAGIAALEGFGCEVELSPEATRSRPFLPDDDAARAGALVDMLNRPDIDAVLCARGGYGASRLLPYLREADIRPRGRFMGFSDVTALHAFLTRAAGVECIWGPMAAVNFRADEPPRVTELALKALAGQLQGEDLLNGLEGVRALGPGVVEAEVVGGTLCLCCETTATPWEIDTEGKILLLEDQNESAYRIDRYMMQLKLAGKLGAAAGFLLGRTFCKRTEDDGFPRSLDDLIEQHILPLGVPVLADVPTGHHDYCIPIPYGRPVRLTSDAGQCGLLVV